MAHCSAVPLPCICTQATVDVGSAATEQPPKSAVAVTIEVPDTSTTRGAERTNEQGGESVSAVAGADTATIANPVAKPVPTAVAKTRHTRRRILEW
jgi:hypothetical protein